MNAESKTNTVVGALVLLIPQATSNAAADEGPIVRVQGVGRPAEPPKIVQNFPAGTQKTGIIALTTL